MNKSKYIGRVCPVCRKKMTSKSLRKLYETEIVWGGKIMYTRIYHECGAMIASNVGEDLE